MLRLMLNLKNWNVKLKYICRFWAYLEKKEGEINLTHKEVARSLYVCVYIYIYIYTQTFLCSWINPGYLDQGGIH